MLREWRLHALSIFSLTVAFVCLGAALLAVFNLRAVETRWAEAGRATVYLRDDATREDVQALEAALKKLPTVLEVRYLSGGDAFRDLAGAAPQASTLAALPVEAFPASLELEMVAGTSDEEVAAVVDKLRKLPSVEDVETYRAWTEKLARLVRGGVLASALLAAVVLASVLAVVGSTIRLALQRRRAEVEVLKLVGATDRFVRGPFVIEGAVQGAFGATCALVLLGVLFLLVRARFDTDFTTLIGVAPSFLPLPATLAMVGAGGLLGAVAALLSLRRLVAV
jgi:cell division transport system permease protein